MSSPAQDASKKQYERPGLKVYGTIEGITASVLNNSTNKDGGTGAMQKTH